MPSRAVNVDTSTQRMGTTSDVTCGYSDYISVQAPAIRNEMSVQKKRSSDFAKFQVSEHRHYLCCALAVDVEEVNKI